MARPMLLIQKALLTELYSQYSEGVPVSKLISKFSLDITHPTLGKLLTYMENLQLATDEDHEARHIINASLFPEWLANEAKPIVKQPYSWRYEGKMPLGKWVEVNWES